MQTTTTSQHHWCWCPAIDLVQGPLAYIRGNGAVMKTTINLSNSSQRSLTSKAKPNLDPAKFAAAISYPIILYIAYFLLYTYLLISLHSIQLPPCDHVCFHLFYSIVFYLYLMLPFLLHLSVPSCLLLYFLSLYTLPSIICSFSLLVYKSPIIITHPSMLKNLLTNSNDLEDN